MLSSYKRQIKKLFCCYNVLSQKKVLIVMAHAMKSLKLHEIGERGNYHESESTKLLTNLPNLIKGGVNE
jgi:hypothetical protein